MKYFIHRLILLILFSFSVFKATIIAQYTSKNNYKGSWGTSTSWVPAWNNPQNTVSGFNISINGCITVNGALSFTGSSGNLVIHDTLVVMGDLTLGDHNNLLITSAGVLIVWGNLSIDRADIVANGYFVVVNDIVKTKQFNNGSFSSNQNPGKVFIGGSIPPELSGGNTKFSALDCTKQNAYIYPNSLCSYGNLNDLAKTPLFDFYRSTCSLSAPTVNASGPLSFCVGGSVHLTASAGKSYLWSDGTSKQSISVTSSGNYSVRVTDKNLCLSTPSQTIGVNVFPLPAKPSVKVSPGLFICSGDTITFESDEAAGYLWSTGAKTKTVSICAPGDYYVKVSNEYGCSNSSDPLHLVVYPLPEVPQISASGPLIFCSGDSVILNAGEGAEYIWSDGEKSPAITVKKTGNYSVRVKNSQGCLSGISLPVNIVVNALPQVSINAGEAVCINSTMEISGIPAGGVFKVLDGSANIVNNLLTASKPGNVMVEYRYTGLCSNSVTKNILVTDLPKAIPGPNQTLTSSRETIMQAQLLSSEKGEWSLVSGSGKIMDIHSPASQITALGTGKNVFQWKVSKDDCISHAEVTVTVNDFIIPSVITPNGDGENEFFFIDPGYGKVKLLIFNKWGKVEYQSDNYLNDWNGRSSKGLALPEDTYFYILHFAKGVVKKGSVLIKR